MLERQAKTRMQELRLARMRGTLRVKPDNIRVTDAIEDFVSFKKATVRPVTARSGALTLRYFLTYLSGQTSIKHIGQVKARDIEGFVAWLTSDNVERLYDRVRAQRQGRLSDSTVSVILGMLGSFFNYLEAEQSIGENPMKSKRVMGLKKRYKRREVKRIYADHDVERILSWTRECGETDVADFVEVLAYTGLRSGEAVHLWWSHVDLVRGEIRVEPHGDWVPKTASSIRPVPIPLRLRRVLAQRKLSNRARDNDPVFAFPGKTEKRTKPYRVLRRALRALGLDEPDANGERLNLHAFRHWFLTKLADSGVPVHKVQRIAGHSRLITTQRYFTVADADLHDDIARVFGPDSDSFRVKSVSTSGALLRVPADFCGQDKAAVQGG